MNLLRAIKHLVAPDWLLRRGFSSSRIQKAIRQSEKQHHAELCFAVEGGLSLHHLLAGTTPRQRAAEVFSLLRVWDTEHNSGVLIYVQRVDRRIEIVADRGIAAKVAEAEWSAVCRAMEKSFKDGRFTEGALEAIQSCGRILARHFPAQGARRNELPDRPVFL
jgi:uncharacterized membrane protein